MQIKERELMNVNIEDYLSDNEIKSIIEEEFRNKIKSIFNTEKEISRIITNLGYYNTFKIIEEEIPGFRETVKEQTKKRCLEISKYCVFREKTDYDSESLGQKYLNESVEENRNIINSKVKEIMNDLSKQDIADEINGIVTDKIENLFKGKE